MDLIVLFVGLIIIALIVIVGGGIGLFFWFKSRKNKKVWIARCYQKSQGLISHKLNKGDIQLNELIPYAKDKIERIEYTDGRKIYRLMHLNLTIQEITADSVENWGKTKEVNVLVEEDQATILKKGYDNNLAKTVWKPMPRERVEMIKSEMTIKLKRVQQEKSFLASVIPFITIGISFLALFAISYFLGQTFVEMSENLMNGMEDFADSQLDIAKEYSNVIEKIDNRTVTADKLYLNEINIPKETYESIE